MKTEIKIDPSRLALLNTAALKHGGGDASKGMGCVMNWANFLAGDSGTSDDHPCVSRSIRGLLIRLNDRLPDADRQLLKPYAEKVLGTAATEKIEQKRAWMAADFAIRTLAPLWLERAGLKDEAAELRGLPDVTPENHEKARAVVRAARMKAWDQYDARMAELRKKHGAADAAADAAAAYAAAGAADAAYAADAAAKGKPLTWNWKQKEAIYKEVKAKTKAAILEKTGPTRKEALSLVLGLLDRMIALSPGGAA